MAEDSCTRREFVGAACAAASLALAPPALVSCATQTDGAGDIPAVKSAAIVTASTVYPDDAFSRPFTHALNVFETMVGCSVGGDIFHRARHFVKNELHLAEWEGQTCTRWRAQTRGADTWPLTLQPVIRRRPEAVSFTAKNNAPFPIAFIMYYNEHAWRPKHEKECANWTLGERHFVQPGEARDLQFLFEEAHPAEAAALPNPTFPGGVTLYAQGFKPDTEFEFLFRDLAIHYPAAPGLCVRALDCPDRLRGGRRAAFSMAVEGDVAARCLDLEVRRDPHVLWRTRLTPEERKRLRLVRTVPTWIPAGEVTAGLVADGYRVAGIEACATIVNARTPGFPRVDRRPYKGRPTCFVNGRPMPWQGYASADYEPGNVGEFGRSGATVFCINASAGRRLNFSTAAPTWLAPGKSDYGQLDELVCMSLQANPEAMVFLRIHFALPPFWDQAHEDELVRVRTADGTFVYEEESTTRVGSLASEAWRRDQTQALRELIRHCKQQPWADRLAGFWVDGETTEEWFAYGSNDGLYCDYSRPNQEGFARWLAANRRHFEPLADTLIPMPEMRKHPGSDLYPQEESGRRAAAYNQYYADLTADTIGHFARIVKEETEGRCLAGTFYGYVIQLAGEPRQTLAGHAALRKVLDDPNVDYLAGIPLHNFRRIDGYSAFVSATESILAAGKLYCNENDLFSWLHPWHWYTEYDPANPRSGAIRMHQREIANQAVHGAVGQWFSLQTNWHHDAALQEEFARLIRLQAESVRYDRTSVAEAAFIVDDTTFSWTPPESVLLAQCYPQLLYYTGKTGVPVGVWLLSDLDRLPDRVRFIIIACATAAYSQDVRKLHALIERGGKTIVVVGAPGFVDPAKGAYCPQRPAEVLGLPIRVDDAPLPGDIVLCSGGSPVTTLGKTVRPRAACERDGFLKYTDGPCAGIERPLDGAGRLIWCGMPPLSSPLLRKWMEEESVHAYAPLDCFVYASRELVSITSPIAQSVPLQWPKKVLAEDLFDGWRAQGKAMDCPFQAGQTRLFRVTR